MKAKPLRALVAAYFIGNSHTSLNGALEFMSTTREAQRKMIRNKTPDSCGGEGANVESDNKSIRALIS